ncbi:FliH/SctL family protein [Saccharibacillus alkalitolerans]|uniref:Flagellar assembly protein FliH n=1 Tax=Saccharibacillus alkalitolerans TaxID=2705290 RepID=A0ABX0FBU2_9BACL|nr:FliH/SctL family protein [Saccharibacillus alkalitolerans]NGZ75507.1 flagellar assembly protein FliH [Saccharibacillus alkalitolerans]
MSNLIKSSQYVPKEDFVKLDLHRHYASKQEYAEGADEPQLPVADKQTVMLKDEMIRDAKEFAELQIREAAEQAERMLLEAQQQIEAWWQERREQDEHLVEAVKSQGFREGYEEGKIQAEAELAVRMQQASEEAQELIKEAVRTKEEIIQEAEPFLVDLSSAIAEKVIDRKLEEDQELTLSLIRKTLSRKREQGTIALCVAPSQFSLINSAREELAMSIDSQAELQILPDATVQDRGCVIRSNFGSVDARIDTQLSEIKRELLRLALHEETPNA